MRLAFLVLACVLATAVAVGTENEEKYQVLTPEDPIFKPIHEQSVAEGMDLLDGTPFKPSRHERRLLIQGVQQPDLQAAFPTKIEIFGQGVTERVVQTKKHDFMALRVATQHIHAVSFALKMYKKGVDQLISVPDYPIPKDNGFETLSFVNNRQVHNKMLETMAGWFWIALADKNETQAMWKLGNVLHSLGDSFAGGHTHRNQPTETAQPKTKQPPQSHSRFGKIDCSSPDIIMFHSMDVANWNNHIEPDLQTKDWRFHCLKQHIAHLITLWKQHRPKVRAEKREDKRIEAINGAMKEVADYLCHHALHFNESRLEWPAGGQVAGFSSLSELKMTKNSKAPRALLNHAKWKRKLGGPGDQPILPIGLTTPELSEKFISEVAYAVSQQDADNKKLKTVVLHGFTYPTRSEKWYCDKSREYKDFMITGPVYTAIQQGLAPKDHWVDWKGMGAVNTTKEHALLDEVAHGDLDSMQAVLRANVKDAIFGALEFWHTRVAPLVKEKPNPSGKALFEAMVDGKKPYD